MSLLCKFANRFPSLAAEILERDRHKRRNFREETITDILMAGLVPFEPLDIQTDYPVDESATGEDMDWEFVDEHAVDGRCYLRLHIQAKRARLSNGKKTRYWLYNELDHAVKPKPPVGTPKLPKGAPKSPTVYGTQHELLLNEAAKVAGCVPLYMFYHPASSLQPQSGVMPAIEGVNWMFADQIPVKTTPKRWRSETENWQPSDRIFTRFVTFCALDTVGSLSRYQIQTAPLSDRIAASQSDARRDRGQAERTSRFTTSSERPSGGSRRRGHPPVNAPRRPRCPGRA